jgi:hypothetical protein
VAPSVSMWPSALEIANELITEGTAAMGREENAVRDRAASGGRRGHRAFYEVVTESPASPDPEVGIEAVSDASDAGERQGTYQPLVSSVTDVPSPKTPPSPPRLLGPSDGQKYWSKLQSHASRPQRIAMVRPRVRRRSATARRRHEQRYFRIIAPAPVISTQSILSRVISANGDVAEETMQRRFDIARSRATQTVIPPPAVSILRTMSTQTLIPLYADVQTSTSDDCPANVVVLRVGGIRGGRPPPVEVSVEATASQDGLSDATVVNNGSPSEDTEGTPLLDE